jgi:hypothetical protein
MPSEEKIPLKYKALFLSILIYSSSVLIEIIISIFFGTRASDCNPSEQGFRLYLESKYHSVSEYHWLTTLCFETYFHCIFPIPIVISFLYLAYKQPGKLSKKGAILIAVTVIFMYLLTIFQTSNHFITAIKNYH